MGPWGCGGCCGFNPCCGGGFGGFGFIWAIIIIVFIFFVIFDRRRDII